MEQAWTISDYHQYVPTFALSSGLRMWIKLIMSKTHFLDDSTHTEFKVEVNAFTVLIVRIMTHVHEQIWIAF